MNDNTITSAINQLTNMRFIFHAWKDLPILDNDGVMCNLDTRMLDVDFKPTKDNPISSGTANLKRLRLLPVNSTQKPIISNHTGFSVSNVVVGSANNAGQYGYGAGMMGASRKTNVNKEWVSPEEKIVDLSYTFGKYGLIAIQSLSAQNEEQLKSANKVFAVVMSGLPDSTLLEDIPEYFEDLTVFGYLPEKPKSRLTQTAQSIVEESGKGVEVDGKTVKLNTLEYNQALALIEELKASVMQAVIHAVDVESGGILPTTQQSIESKQKYGYDALDKWLMGQFPSYPMDSTLEKSNKQILRALDATGGNGEVVESGVPMELYLEEKRRNDNLSERLAALEAKAA